jgi:hypothetical protein
VQIGGKPKKGQTFLETITDEQLDTFLRHLKKQVRS